jgi:hypothetical protein
MVLNSKSPIEGHEPSTLQAATLAVAKHYHGLKGVWAFELFQEFNRLYFDDELPWPNISWALTPYGACLGYTYQKGPASIVLHPSLLRGSEKHNPWKVPSAWLGWRLAADVLLHEMIHLSVIYRQGGWSGPGTTSHNNKAWVQEVNRLLGLLEIPGSQNCQAGITRIQRVPTEGPATIRGKRPTRVERITEGNLPFGVVAGFPYAIRQHLSQANRYYQGLCPACLPACDAPQEPPEERSHSR